jgi:Predicted pPIWI-associating nuclease
MLTPNPAIVPLLEHGFERELYSAAIQNLVDHNNKLRLNNFAYAMRELTRHALDRLAPTASVVKCSWYRDETGRPNRPSRKQRARYAIQGGLPDDYVRNSLGIQTDNTHLLLMQAIDNLSKFTHIQPAVFGLSDAEVDAHVQQTDQAMMALCSTIHDCHQQIIAALSEKVDTTVIDAALRETLLEIDEIATHYSIEDICTEHIEITSITHDEIVINAKGSIGTELQWGSNSDVRRGDGILLPQYFPFTCSLSSPVDEPDQVEARENSLSVDTSSWRSNYYD